MAKTNASRQMASEKTLYEQRWSFICTCAKTLNKRRKASPSMAIFERRMVTKGGRLFAKKAYLFMAGSEKIK